MPLGDRDYIRGSHPPTCTCADCVEKRLKKRGARRRLGEYRPKNDSGRQKQTTRSVSGIISGIQDQAGEYELNTSTGNYTAYPSPPPAVVLFIRKIWWTVPIKLRKFLLSALAIALISAMSAGGYRLFTHKMAPVVGSVVFLLEGAVLAWIVIALRSARYRRTKPSFILVFLAILFIIIIFAFAGVEPFSSYKDNTFNWVSDRFTEWTS